MNVIGRTKLTSKTRRVVTAALLVGTILASGCGPSDHEINSFIHSKDASVSAVEYVVQPPDVLDISSSQAVEIDGESQTIRQDGKITLRLLGEVKVAGLTPTEIAQKLEGLLARYYQNPKVNVRVTGTNSKQYYVFGDNTVMREGVYSYTGRDTLLNALALAQPNRFAWKGKIKLIRPAKDSAERHVMTIDADRLIQGGKTDQNVLLQEGDIIYVPATPWSWLGMRISEFLYPVQATGQTVAQPVVIRDSAEQYDSSGRR
ncbi:MAG: polysaccharide biosynthesis/export family protein [Planctomycetes bacterium]|nr:polysaccharide biosynthesis/export family protein [Planctomycetota bacterium]